MSSSEGTSAHAGWPLAEYLQRSVERITFHNEESGYIVLRLSVSGEHELITVIGRLPEIHTGQTLHLAGFWWKRLEYRRQFTASEQILVAQLTEVFRQMTSSVIVTNSYRINANQFHRLRSLQSWIACG